MFSDNETWIIEEGDRLIRKMASIGDDSLVTNEKMIYCLWVADYSIRNAGDLDSAEDMVPELQEKAVHLARELKFDSVANAFELPKKDFEAQYYERFDGICSEIRGSG